MTHLALVLREPLKTIRQVDWAMWTPFIILAILVLISVDQAIDSVLGLDFALIRLGVALVMGLLAGFATLGIQRLQWFKSPLKPSVDLGCSNNPIQNPNETKWAFWHERARTKLFGQTFTKTGGFLLKWMAIAFVLESLMLAYLPADAIGAWLGMDSIWSVVLAVIVGVPAYLNSYAAIPLVNGLMELGMSDAVALAFLTAGAVSSFPAAMAVFALVKRSVFVWYVALALIGSFLMGVVLLL